MPNPAPRPRVPAALVRLAVLGGLFLAPACGQGSAARQEAGASGARQRDVPRVRVVAVEEREMVRRLETTTVVESELEVEVFPRIPGIVVELLAEEGNRVSAGQPLARLDTREQENALSEAQVALDEAHQSEARLSVAAREADARVAALRLAAEQAERDYQRDLRLYESQKVASGMSERAIEASKLARDNTAAELEQALLAVERAKLDAAAAKTTIERARLAVDAAKLTLSYGEVRSPIDGVVARRSCRAGQSLAAQQIAFVVTDIESILAVFFRPQAELSLFAGADDGLPVSARAEAVPGAVFEGAILRTSPTIDPSSGSFRVTARLETVARDAASYSDGSAARRLLPGMLVRLSIVTDRHPDALVVPKRALRREGELVYVLIADDGTVRRVEVEEGYSNELDVELLPRAGGLAPGDEVVVVGSRELEEGSPVEVEREAPDSKSKAGARRADVEGSAR